MSKRITERRFYRGEQLQLILSQFRAQQVFGTEGLALAEQHTLPGWTKCLQLATHSQGSPLSVVEDGKGLHLTYSCYGVGSENNDLITGYTGQQQDRHTGCYILGNGYRAYNPVLRRFHSPDDLSPFGEGGLNAYVYCNGDPVNKQDPSGHIPSTLKLLFNLKDYRPAAKLATQSGTGYEKYWPVANHPDTSQHKLRKMSNIPLYQENINTIVNKGGHFDIDTDLRLASLQNKLHSATKKLDKVLKSITPSVANEMKTARSQTWQKFDD
ncbi:RHS repeat-associated core domain-containing protein [Pseudomonas sp. SWRI107]|uniref:RHS repeat-associated core domain-containing protein n=1 Tax=Pseudomonas farsensis TaxID=2745492 RepID=UPI0016461D2D|nr:RHS repeat-associated core domain-containing protein [Pseudomonas farsensis]MBV4533976.1 RHS repeat-associated core domain-containing protein [Pseudomonas farsensis]